MGWTLVDNDAPQSGATYPVNFIQMLTVKGAPAYNGPHVGFYRETRNGSHIFEDTGGDVYIGMTHWASIDRPPFQQPTCKHCHEEYDNADIREMNKCLAANHHEPTEH